jgi:hypothetical protein
MRILRTTLPGLLAVGAVGTLSLSVLAGGQDAKTPATSHDMTMAKTSTMTKAQKITNAMSAAPSSLSAKATILDWPAKDGEQPPVLRAGSNGWTCFPDMPQSSGNDPMCLDAPWMKWLEAYLAHTPLAITSVGVSYMLAPGGAEGSNTDPYAMKMTPDNHWGHHAPHVMIAVPDVQALDGLPTDPKNGGPYVMWKGTPYAHIMAPVTAK